MLYHSLLYKSKRPVMSKAAGEILIAGEPIDEGLVLKRAYVLLQNMDIELIVALYPKDLFSSLPTQRKSVDRSVRANVNFIIYQFETSQANRICCIPGRLNLADSSTKPDSPLVPALQHVLLSGRLPLGFQELEATFAIDDPLG